MSRAPCSPSTEPPAPKGRKPRLRTSTRPNAKGALSASTAGSAPYSACRGSCVPVFQLRTGRSFPQGFLSETMSHSGRGFWDAFSATALATCRRRPGLHRARRAPACGGDIRARRAWRAPGGGAHAESARTGQPHHHRSYRQEDAPRPRCGHRCGRSPPRRKDARQSYRA